MKHIARILVYSDYPLWKFSLFPAFAGTVMAIFLLFEPSQAMCERARLLPDSSMTNTLVLCAYKGWFAAGSAAMAIIYIGALYLVVCMTDSQSD